MQNSSTAADPGNITAIADIAILALLPGLASDDPKIREKAVRALPGLRNTPGLKNERIMDSLLAALRDPHIGVRTTAMFPLTESNDPRITEALVAVARFDVAPSIRSFACDRLGKRRDVAAVDSLIAVLRYDSASNVRGRAAAALSAFKGPPIFHPLLAALADPVGEVRAQAVSALGRLKDEQSVDALAGMLSDADPAVSRAATDALGRLGHPPSVDLLIATIRGRFGRLARTSVLESVLNYLQQQEMVRLVEYLADPDEAVREAVGGTLRWSLRAMPAIAAVLPLSMPRERLLLVGYLAETGSTYDDIQDARTKAIGPVLQRATDAEAKVRAAAIEGLGALHAAEEMPILLAACSDPEACVRRAAAWALGALEDTSAVNSLTDLLIDPDSSVRAHAVTSLGLFYNEALDPLLKARRDPSPTVRRHITQELLWRVDDAGQWLVEARESESYDPARPPSPASLSVATNSNDALPDSLRHAVDNALAVMKAHPEHHLPPSLRQPIYDGFGSRLDSTANYARGRLALWTARRVLPFFEQSDPRDDRPRQFIEMGEDVLVGMVARSGAHGWLLFMTGGETVDRDNISRAANHAADAAINALSEVLGKNGLDHPQRLVIEKEDGTFLSQDELTDAYKQDDAAATAAMATAWGSPISLSLQKRPYKGPRRRPRATTHFRWGDRCRLRVYRKRPFTADKLQAFWEWWLNEAVPSAWTASRLLFVV